ncbi:sensor histidine kinase [Streptomyces sp. NPDC006692]|uniref:sensor histidine kinase n=1 Tax=Streptomyces sp. NPDC006692 TaxID=3364758 RepID=UPI0036C1F20F
MTVVAGLTIGAAVIGGLVLMYLLQMNSVRRTIDGQLRTYVTQISQSGQSGTWQNPLAPSALDPNAQAQVIAADGRVLAATRNLLGLPAVYTLPSGSGTPVRQKAADGVVPSEVRVVGVRTTVDGRPVTIITDTPSGLLSEVNEGFAHQLLFGVPAILGLAAGTVWLIVGRALRPVERIRRAVTDITSADLSQRVPEPGTVDEIGKLATTMNDMLARLDESGQRQRRFVADASHELRSPLAAIRTTLEVGLAHPDRAPWPKIAERAAEQTQRLEELIQQLLLLAKADDRQLAAQQRPVDLAGLFVEIRTTTPAAAAHGVHIDLKVARGVVIVGDPTHLERMLRNIVDNAVRYARTTVTVTATTGADTVHIGVDDDGPGIPAEDRERVFGRFVRLDDSRERGTGNSGLGLAIAREIVLAHDGRIAITSSPAAGTRVTIVLPQPAASGDDIP